ncbi:hypothetical protein DPMN_175880 [Dreissena polymorpha]|uniref:Uncharacterized protein n=1 Tax=Dreissena polymorpha TaxID=45954 RepID=A0A9D4IK14_DREPO|nr:hypothetical protein DPMN_175880 [Dreissena polymorpha]
MFQKSVTDRQTHTLTDAQSANHKEQQETNVLTKFHENWAKNVTSSKNAPPIGSHVFSPIWTIFELVRDINKTNVLTNFHDDWAKNYRTKNVASRVFTNKCGRTDDRQRLVTKAHLSNQLKSSMNEIKDSESLFLSSS